MSLSNDIKKVDLYQPFGLTRTIPLAYFINTFICMIMLINNIVYNIISIIKGKG